MNAIVTSSQNNTNSLLNQPITSTTINDNNLETTPIKIREYVLSTKLEKTNLIPSTSEMLKVKEANATKAGIFLGPKKPENALCLIKIEEAYAYGFLIILPYFDSSLKALITSSKILNKELIYCQVTINITYLEGKLSKDIKIDAKRKIFYFEKDQEQAVILEVFDTEVEDGVFLEVDAEYISKGFETYLHKTMILYQHSEGLPTQSFYGTITKIDAYKFSHNIAHNKGSVCSPIILYSNLKVIGINLENCGTLLGHLIRKINAKTVIYSNGDKYEGEWKDNVKSGKGVYYYKDGEKYDGEWRDDKYNGKGTYYYANGTKYEGEWKDNMKDGVGVEYYSDGKKYEGTWKDGRKNGRGVEHHNDGAKYEGEIKEGMLCGRGVLTYPNGDKYEGTFYDNKKNGKGVFTYSNGDVYEGEFKDDEKCGRGAYIFAKINVRCDGEWKGNVRVSRGRYYELCSKNKEDFSTINSEKSFLETSELVEINKIISNNYVQYLNNIEEEESFFQQKSDSFFLKNDNNKIIPDIILNKAFIKSFYCYDIIIISPKSILEAFKTAYNSISSHISINYFTDLNAVTQHIEKTVPKKSFIVISPCYFISEIINQIINEPKVCSYIFFCHGSHKHKSINDLKKNAKISGIVYANEQIFKILKEKIDALYIPTLNYGTKFPKERKKISITLSELNENFKFKFSKDSPSLLNSIEENIIHKMKEENELKAKKNILLKDSIKLLYNLLLNKTDLSGRSLIFEFLTTCFERILVGEDASKIREAFYLFNYHMFLIIYYFSNYDYLHMTLGYDEVRDLVKSTVKKIEKDDGKRMLELYKTLDEMLKLLLKIGIKITKNETILEDNSLKELHRLVIKFIVTIKLSKFRKFYQTLSFLRDIEFTLKYLVYTLFANKNDNFFNLDEYNMLFVTDKRLNLTFIYEENISKENAVGKEQLDETSRALKIKDAVVIGNEFFQTFVKNLKLSVDRFHYPKLERLKDFFAAPKFSDKKYKIFNYFVIIDEGNFVSFHKTLQMISISLGVNLLVVIYVKDKLALVDKRFFIDVGSELSIIFTYSDKDLQAYFAENNTDKYPCKLINLVKSHGKKHNILNSSINFFNKETDFGWEIIKEANKIAEKNSIINIPGGISISNFIVNVIDSYRQNNAIDLFLSRYCAFFHFYVNPEFYQLLDSIIQVKQILYTYTLDEDDRTKSFAFIINRDLLSINPIKISAYTNIFRMVSSYAKLDLLRSHCGKAYRATYFTPELINKVNKNQKIINACLWAASKDEKSAMKSLFEFEYKNVLLVAGAVKGNNVDVDEEKISLKNEKEILFLPYSVFLVKSVEYISEVEKRYYKIDMEFLCSDESFYLDNFR